MRFSCAFLQPGSRPPLHAPHCLPCCSWAFGVQTCELPPHPSCPGAPPEAFYFPSSHEYFSVGVWGGFPQKRLAKFSFPALLLVSGPYNLFITSAPGTEFTSPSNVPVPLDLSSLAQCSSLPSSLLLLQRVDEHSPLLPLRVPFLPPDSGAETDTVGFELMRSLLWYVLLGPCVRCARAVL